MVSRTKVQISPSQVTRIYMEAGFSVNGAPTPITDGEFNAIFSVDTDKGKTVIKLSPNDDSALLTYEKGIMKREIDFYNLITEKTDIPVPMVLYSDLSCERVPFQYFIMEKIDGVTLDKTDMTPERKRTEIMKILSSMHKISGSGFGYRGEFDSWYTALRSMTVDLMNDGEKKLAEAGALRPLLQSELKKGRRLLRHIDNNKDILAQVSSVLVNFDLWDKNMILSGDRVYMIDPERAFWGDFTGDFIMSDMMKLSLADRTEAIMEYNKYSTERAVADRNAEIRFLLLYAYLCLLISVEKFYRYAVTNPGFIRNMFMDFNFSAILRKLKKYEDE